MLQGYAQNFKEELYETELKLEAQLFGSQSKREKHHMASIIFHKENISEDQHCSCTKGRCRYWEAVVAAVGEVDSQQIKKPTDSMNALKADHCY